MTTSVAQKRQETVHVEDLLELLEQQAVGRRVGQDGAHLVESAPVWRRAVVRLVGLLLERRRPVSPEVAEEALPEVAVLVLEVAPQEVLVDGLDVDVDTHVPTVDRHVGEVAARSGDATRREDLKGEALPHVGRILLRVAEGHPVEAVEGLIGDELVELEAQGRHLEVQRPDETLLPHSDTLPTYAIHRHGRREVGEDLVDGLGQALPVRCGGEVEPRPVLVAKRVPVGREPSRWPPRSPGRVEHVARRIGGEGRGLRLVRSTAASDDEGQARPRPPESRLRGRPPTPRSATHGTSQATLRWLRPAPNQDGSDMRGVALGAHRRSLVAEHIAPRRSSANTDARKSERRQARS